MGLENGIFIKTENFDIPKEYQQDEDLDKDICYWRKWISFRNELLSKLYEKQRKCYEFVDYEENILLDVDDLLIVLETLQKQDKDDWYSPIWEWEDVQNILKQNIKSIKWLIEEKKKNPFLLIEFYDSY